MHRSFAMVSVCVLLAVGAAACSSGDDAPAATTTTTAAGAAGALSAEVREFCDQTAAVGEELRAAIEDPDATAESATEVVARADQLTQQTAALSAAHPEEATAINECAQQLSVTP